MDEETLTTLLRGQHINMPERVARGMWPHPPLHLADVLAHLTKLLHQHKWFPREWQPHSEGKPVNEGGTIERQESDQYVYRAVRAHPLHPHVSAQNTEQLFSSAEDAARYYLKWDLHLPGDLDGWKVIE
jgi:hypothetical protein